MNVMEGAVGESWIIDSGCSFHVSSHKHWFESFEASNGSVLLGNNQVCVIRGIGNIRLRLLDGSVILLTDVRFIPEIKRNLVSLGLLETRGYGFKSENGKLIIYRDSKTVMTAIKRQSLYYLKADVITGSANVADKQVSVNTWHIRMGHLGTKGMIQLGKKGVFKLQKDLDLSKCEQCMMGKSKKLPFPKGKHTSGSVLEYAHSDIWGPSQPATMSGGRYFMTIIDDYSRKLWVQVLKEKSEAIKFFKEWHLMVEREKKVSLKCLRTDNGLEYLSSEFTEYCKSKGIQRHRTAPRNPQQNGVAERMNRTILERVRCMLLTSGVDKRFWGEAVATAAVLINKSPSSAVNFDVPDARWYGHLPDFSKLRSFGCRAYAHIKQGKLESRALRCIFLGYQSGSKAYRLWCTEPRSGKLVVSRDVTFDEASMPYLTEVRNKSSIEVESADQGNNEDTDVGNDTRDSASDLPIVP